MCSQRNTKKIFKKTSKLSYTRAKKVPPKRPDKALYEEKVNILDKYSMLEKKGKIDIFYFDESGFSISSNMPYLWSEINNTAKVKTLTNKRINTLGFLSKKGKLKSFITEDRVGSDKVIEVFNEFSKTITMPTVVVLDNASFHKSKKFKSNIARWNNLGLTIFYLPPYSPHLNIIETLWRFMKHVWIDYRAFLSIDNLRSYIENIFIYYGIFYIVDFGGIS